MTTSMKSSVKSETQVYIGMFTCSEYSCRKVGIVQSSDVNEIGEILHQNNECQNGFIYQWLMILKNLILIFMYFTYNPSACFV